MKTCCIVFLILLSLGCTGESYSQQEKERIKSQYTEITNTLSEDTKKLNQISSKYPSSMTNEQYLSFANEYTLQLQLFSSHLSISKEFIYENQEILESMGMDTYKTRMVIEDYVVFCEYQAKTIENNLKKIQYQQEQQKKQQEQILGLLGLLL